MQEFLLNNTVSCNLMSLTGYRTLVLLSMLMDSPKSADEINNYFISHPHIKEKFSKDTLRIYMNSLRAIGCKISRANKSNGNKYELLSHPFGLEISKSQLKALSRLYENIYDKLELENLLAVESLLEKISLYVQDEKVRDYLKNISILKNINKKLLKELMFHCSQNHQISFLYNSPNSKEKNIKIIAQKITVKSSKIYLCGYSLTHGESSYFRVDKILKISVVDIRSKNDNSSELKIVYELDNSHNNYTLVSGEKIVSEKGAKLLIEATSHSKFNLMQRILYMSDSCEVLEPKEFRALVVKKLKLMKESYGIE